MASAAQSGDSFALGRFTRVGLGSAFNSENWSVASLRTAMIVLGTGLLACGTSSELFQRGFTLCKDLDWEALFVRIIRVA
ncbi:hypothetical protein F4818DRAFT_446105 [Hypoxylon cercidicola]|nr:hypothetical protein F4818DRAFT_446105 [Hypoxylon cercidicola]